MLKHYRLVFGLAFALAGVAAGCGGGGGSAGDQNDPATTTDLEQMADETDENLRAEQGMNAAE